MLRALHIENYVLIDSLDLPLDKGFTAITGETGAGKSILVGALSLILGARTDSSVLYNTSKKCIVEGVFDIQHLQLEGFFKMNDLDFNNHTLLRREVTENGSRAFVNDTPVTLNIIKELAEKLVDIHSQHHHLLLNKSEFRLQTIDDFALLRELVLAYQQIFNQYKNLEKELQESKEKATQKSLEKDFLTFQSNELHAAKLYTGEQEELEQQIVFLKNAENIKTQLYKSLQIISEQEGNTIQLLNEAKNVCHSIAQFDEKINNFDIRLNNILVELKDIAFELNAKEESVEVKPEELQYLENRLDTLFRLQQKHYVKNVEELLLKLQQIDENLSQCEDLEAKIEQLQKEYEILTEKVAVLAKNLSEQRATSALLFEKEIEKKLVLLGMPDAVFQVEIMPQSTFANTGTDLIEFLFSANKGMSGTPVGKTASGGELSRIMLAIKSVITATSFMPTVIFDEIDTGVSGSMASKVAEVMYDVSLQRQLLTITHLPQIAAQANTHYLVFKDVENEKSVTKIKKIEGQERIAEIAKMMTGNKTGEAAFKVAAELLKTVFCFLLFFGVFSCFGQQMHSPKDSPHFVYPTSLSLAYGAGNTFNGFETVPNGSISCEIQQVLAYQFNNYFFTGMGTGLDFWVYNKKVSTFIPIFANATVKFMDKKTSPFIFANIGYAFKWQVEKTLNEDIFYGTKPGIHFQSGLGINLKFSEKISLLFAAYYKMQQSANKFRESDLVLAETNNQLFHFIGVKVAFKY
jgi:DNA repair protein RecN (Recombination protein N)